MRKKVCLIGIVTVLTAILLSSVVFADTISDVVVAKFADVPSPELDRNFESIYKIVAAGIMTGDSDGLFEPNRPLTHVELAEILTKTLRLSRLYTHNSFEDVQEDYWGYDYIMTVVDHGFLDAGLSVFNPLAVVSNTEMNLVLANLGMDGIGLDQEYVTRGEIASIVCYHIEFIQFIPLVMPILEEVCLDHQNKLADVGFVRSLLGDYSTESTLSTVKNLAHILLEYTDITYDNYVYYTSKIKDSSNLDIVKCYSEGLLTLDTQGYICPDKNLSRSEVYTILQRLMTPLIVERPVYEKVEYVPILMYHEIKLLPKNGPSGLYVSPDNFIKQLDALQAEGYHTITMDQLYNHWENKIALPSKPIVLTFDDGYESHYDFVWVELAKRGMVGTFYIITSTLKEGNLQSAIHLKNMYLEGMEIGSHTITHLDIRNAKNTKVKDELIESKRILSEMIGVEVTNFCYPFGGFRTYAIQVLKDAGYHTAVITKYGKAKQVQGLFVLKRIRIDYYDSITGYLGKIK